MPTMNDIVDVEITLQSSAVARQGFNSLMLAGKTTSFKQDEPNPWTVGEVRKYEKFADITSDKSILAGGAIYNMAQVAFAQSPAVTQVYVGYLAEDTLSADDLTTLRESNDQWFGYCSEWNSASDITLQETELGGVKYGFYLLEDDVSAASPSGYDGYGSYTSLWHTKSTDAARKWINVAIASRILCLQPGSYTAAFKSLEGVDTSKYTKTEEGYLRPERVDANTPATCAINQYSFVGGRGITWTGVTANVEKEGFIDDYIGILYTEARITEDVYSLLASADKIPYTQGGVQTITTAVQARLQQGVSDGFLSGAPAPVVVAPDVVNVAPDLKAGRQLPDIEFFAVTAGSVHTVNIRGSVQI